MSALTELQSLKLPEESTLSAGANAALRMADTFTIADASDYALAADELKAIKAKMSALEEQRMSITRPMDAAKKMVMDLFRGPLDALAKAEGTFKRSMLAYDAEQQRIAAEARRVAEAAAAAERARLQAEAAEVARAAEEERRKLAEQAEAARAAGNAEAAQRAEAEAAQKREAAEAEAAALQSLAAVTIAQSPIVEANKTKGISTSKTLDFDVADLPALIKHIAGQLDTTPGLADLLMVDNVRMRAYVKAMGMDANLAGVTVFEKTTLRASK